MSLSQERISYTEDQYLSIEREADERHEYLDGQIYAMAGESPEHGAICTNLTREVSAQCGLRRFMTGLNFWRKKRNRMTNRNRWRALR